MHQIEPIVPDAIKLPIYSHGVGGSSKLQGELHILMRFIAYDYTMLVLYTERGGGIWCKEMRFALVDYKCLLLFVEVTVFGR